MIKEIFYTDNRTYIKGETGKEKKGEATKRNCNEEK